jgi:hypothetical protein
VSKRCPQLANGASARPRSAFGRPQDQPQNEASKPQYEFNFQRQVHHVWWQQPDAGYPPNKRTGVVQAEPIGDGLEVAELVVQRPLHDDPAGFEHLDELIVFWAMDLEENRGAQATKLSFRPA